MAGRRASFRTSLPLIFRNSDVTRREFVYQIIFLALIGALAFLVYSATQANLARLGVDSGFDFLWRRAGFEIGQTLIPFDPDSTIARAFLVALLNTLVLAACAIVLATLLGTVIGIARLSSNWLASALATVYVEIFRNIPSLLQIFFWYFVVLRSLPRSRHSLSLADLIFLNNRGLFVPVPDLGGHVELIVAALATGVLLAAGLARWGRIRRYEGGHRVGVLLPSLLLIVCLPLIALIGSGATWDIPRPARFGYEGGMVLLPEFLALVVGLSMYNATYISEIIRSAFQSVPRGQVEAAQSLALPRSLILRFILFPQALRVILPPLTTVYLSLFKSTSLAAAIAYPEVVSVFVGTVNNLVGQPVTIMAITLAVYAFVSLCVALLMNVSHRRMMARAY